VVGIANWAYTYLHQIAVWWALARVMQARNDWKKTARMTKRRVPSTATAAAGTPARMRPALPAVATRRGLTAVGSFTPRRPTPTGATVAGRLRIRPTLEHTEQDLREVA
jgi:7-keto-8-aminopelargonate synthetase-like enzyme